MNIKEPHVVTGMSRDSAVSQHNPNFVYDAHNIRITTKDGSNSLLSVTNEKGTKAVTTIGDAITGTPIGSSVIGDYIVIFTHEVITRADGETQEHYNDRLNNCDHIYRCLVTSDGATVKEIFGGNASFALENPIETLAVYENESIQKVYWVDGKNQPRLINIVRDDKETIEDRLNFSRKVQLNHTLQVKKNPTGGEFPTGTIQYCFSYYIKNGQETRLLDISPMYYLSPTEYGLAADKNDHSSFNITISGIDTTFDYVRLYAIVRTQENGKPQCRIVGDYAIPNNGSITINDNGVFGRTIEASALYFIGGEDIVAGTIAQKDNTLFLGNIKLKKPSLKNVTVSPTLGPITVYYNSLSENTSTAPSKSNAYYDYNPNNNRSSYFIKRFKYKETYKLGFIAQYENGQWSEPVTLGNMTNNIIPYEGANAYYTGGFSALFSNNDLAALRALHIKRIAPVVVYPHVLGRRVIAQGILCPTVSTYNDRENNAPFAQASWFFRLSSGNNISDKKALPDNGSPQGEIQCADNYMTTGYTHDPDYETEGAKNANHFFLNTKLLTVNSPDIDCVESMGILDLHNTTCNIIGRALTLEDKYRVVDHYLEVENAGINADNSQVIQVSRKLGSHYTRSFCLYCDSMVNSENTEEVSAVDRDKIYGWVIYPWHRSGSLNNQSALNSKQKQNGFTSRTAMLKRNITANAMFAHTYYNNNVTPINMGNYTPEIFNSDQLSGVRISGGGDAFIYYGNIDKIITAEDNYYYAKYGWERATNRTDETDGNLKKTVTELSNSLVSNPPIYWNYKRGIGDNPGTKVSDPVSMKYKSTPHIVLYNESTTLTGVEGIGLHVVEFVRNNVTDSERFGTDITSFNWIRCGESVFIDDDNTNPATLNYLQGDCYFQRYDCLKTYPFTNEDTNSVIEIFSTMLETYVNLDFRTDRNRGSSNNTALLASNFNLYNHLAYEQSGNFFTYHGLDYDRMGEDTFPNTVTWSLEKHFGEDVDNWTSIDVANTLDLDGAMGELTKLINYNNDIYAFQSIGFAQLLFNSRVQIPTSDDTPIEITNGMKMQGKRYISTKVGCINKWSIVETPLGLYFNDDIMRSTYLFNGQLQDISTTKGMKSWMNSRCSQNIWNPSSFSNCRAFYDKVGRDIYWVYYDTALVYSEILNAYMSFMDYGGIPLLENAGNRTYAVLPVTNSWEISPSATGKVHIQGDNHEDGYIVFHLKPSVSATVNLKVKVDTMQYQEALPSAWVESSTGDNTRRNIVIQLCVATEDDADTVLKYSTLDEMKAALDQDSRFKDYFTIEYEGVNGNTKIEYGSTGLSYSVDLSMYNPNPSGEIQSPFWELGAGDYNMFFDKYRPYWLTFISNTQPTENKIYNNLEWRDIVKDTFTDKPFSTFDHLEVWTEHQNTGSVRFTNSIKEFTDKQPIQYNARMSNLRKKFNVWRCQIPRDYIASNSRRARISNPWCYIKLSREDENTYRHEFTDLVVDYFM